MEAKDKLRTLIETWAMTEGLVVGNVHISIVPPTVTANISLSHSKKKPRFHSSDRELEQADWETILALPWSKEQRVIMEVVQKDPHHIIPDEICSKTKYYVDWSIRLNLVFLRNKAGYRFSPCGGAVNRRIPRLRAGEQS